MSVMRLNKSQVSVNTISLLCLLLLGTYFPYINSLSSTTLRLISLTVFTVIVISNFNLISQIGRGIILLIFLYSLWAFFTCSWSPVFRLSLLKTISFFLFVSLYTSLGIFLLSKKGSEHALFFLKPLSLIGIIVIPYIIVAGRGGNRINYYGFIAATAFLYFLYQLVLSYSKINKKLLFILCVICYLSVILSKCRGAWIFLTCPLLLLLINSTVTKKFYMLCSLSLLIAPVLLLNSDLRYSVTNYFHKGHDQSSVFRSRLKPWKRTLNGAYHGGWFGLGFAVTYGDDDDRSKSLFSTGGYGIEKNNTQLAVVEETGLVGFFLYLMVNIYIISCGFSLYRKSTGDTKKRVCVLFGMIIGLIVESIFEAWFGSPFNPESVVFWITSGTIIAMEYNRKKNTYAKPI